MSLHGCRGVGSGRLRTERATTDWLIDWAQHPMERRSIIVLLSIRACSWTIRDQTRRTLVDRLTLFGLFAVTAMLVTYALEGRSHWFILAFAAACVLGSIYGFLQGAWPFGLIEAIWAIVALRSEE